MGRILADEMLVRCGFMSNNTSRHIKVVLHVEQYPHRQLYGVLFGKEPNSGAVKTSGAMDEFESKHGDRIRFQASEFVFVNL